MNRLLPVLALLGLIVLVIWVLSFIRPETTSQADYGWLWIVLWVVLVIGVLMVLAQAAYQWARAAPAPAPTVTATTTSASWSSWTWDPASQVVMAIIIIALAFAFLQYSDDARAFLRDTSQWLVIVAIAALVIGLIYGPWQRILAFTVIALLLIYVLAAYRTGSIYVDLNRMFLYILAIAVAGLAISYLTGLPPLQTWTAAILVGAIFLILGWSHIETYEAARARFGFNLRHAAMCDLIKRETTFNPDSWTNINKGGTCNPEGVWNNGNCFWSRRADWTQDETWYGPHCTTGKLPKDVEWARAQFNTFKGAVSLGPPVYH